MNPNRAIRLTPLTAGLLIALATWLVYANSLTGVFVFDDSHAIAQNPSIRRLWPLWPVLTENRMPTVVGRPLLNLSLALNYALNGTDVGGYHVVNVLIHMAAVLTLFGLVRRTLQLPRLRETSAGRTPIGTAFVTALLWAVHPLTTQSVTYLCQRGESLASLLYLLVFYCVIRGATVGRAALWHAGAVLAALLGVATKEIVGTAPVLMLLYDRLFLTGSFRETVRRRWGLYLGLVASWSLLFALVCYNTSRGNGVWFGCGVTTWEYARTQPSIILHYLKLAFWPDHLVLDYGWPVARTAREILPGIIVIGSLVAGTLWALWRKPWLGFLGVWFFGILAPTSSIIPIIDLAYEHRMYLPLAGVITLVVIVAHRLLIRRQVWVGTLVAVAVIALGARTVARNHDYRSELVIWQGALKQNPRNPRAHTGVATALLAAGDRGKAVQHYRQALEFAPDFSMARSNLAVVLWELGRFDEAVDELKETLRRDPFGYLGHANYAEVLMRQGKPAEAIEHFRKAAERRPDLPYPHLGLGNALSRQGKDEDAIHQYRKALEIDPGLADAHNSLGISLTKLGRLDEAIAEFEQAVRISPDNPGYQANIETARSLRAKAP